MIKKVVIITFIILLISGCRSGARPSDEANRKQVNPDLDRPVTAADCAADGPGCKQFNPDKP